MTPGEVASLQSLAQQHGGSLSINPQTGLPEAGFLSALLPMAAGAGLAAMGMPQGYAALAVGATSALTNGGNMRKSLMDGISAYGGAGMTESFMGAGLESMGTSAAAPTTVLETPSVISAAPAVAPSAGSIVGSSMQEAVNQSGMYAPALTSAAPAEAAQAAAAATPAAQQAAALKNMDIGQRFDALKAGATGTNAMNYIKANPFTSLGVATAAMTPDEPNAPQKAADTDRGARAGMRYYPGWSTPLPKPNMQGIEQTYNRPYYAAEGGVTRMATGGIASAPRNQQQLFADYLQRVSSSGVAATPPTDKYDWWKNPNDPVASAPAAAPVETAEEYAARMRVNARGGGGGRGEKPEPSAWDSMTDTEKTEYYAQHPFESKMADMAGTYLTKGLGFGVLGMGMDAANGPGYVDKKLNILRGIHPPANSPLAGGPLVYSTETEPAGGPIAYGSESGYMANTDPYFSTQLGPGVGTPAYTAPETDDMSSVWAQMDANTTAEKEQQAQQLAAEQKQFERDALRREFRTMVGLVNADPSLMEGEGEEKQAFKDRFESLYSQLGPDPMADSKIAAQTEADRANAVVTPAAEGTPYSLDYQKPETATNPFSYTVSPDGLTTTGLSYTMPVNVRERAEDLKDYGAITNKFNLGTLAPDALRYSDTGVPDALKTPDIVGVNEISADPNADTDKTAESLGIPSAETFAAMIGAPIGTYASAADGSTVSDAGVLGGVPAPNMGYGQGRGAFGIGGVWTNREGVPITTRDGSPVMTGAGAEAIQRAVAESNAAANRTYGNSINSGPANDGRADPGGEGGTSYGRVAPGYTGGSEAATGGLSTPYGFQHMANGGLSAMATPYDLGSYSDGGRLLKGPGDGVSDSIPATIGKGRPARLADGEFVIPARIVSEIGNGSTEAGARKLYAMMDRVQAGRKKSVGKGKVAVNSRADKYLPA